MSTTTFERSTAGTVTVLRVVPTVATVPVGREGVQPAAGRPRVSSQVRLTRRGRIVLLVTALVVAMAVGVLFGAVSVAASEGGDIPTRVVVVSEGDTLWGIAAGIAGEGEVREVMADIERLNALDSAVLQLGQRLNVPLMED